MTPLRQCMLHELQRRNYAPSTIRSYLGAVRQFAEHFHCSPEELAILFSECIGDLSRVGVMVQRPGNGNPARNNIN